VHPVVKARFVLPIVRLERPSKRRAKNGFAVELR
jgi:hypothetical protein